MAVVVLKNGREGECQLFVFGFCSDGNLGDRNFPGDPANFLEFTYPSTSSGASQPCVKFQDLVSDGNCLVSINGLTAGDKLCVPAAGGGTVCVDMDMAGGVAVEYPSIDPVFTTLVGVAVDVTLCNGNGYWTRGPSNSEISMPGRVIMYHELIGHALHICNGTFDASDPEGQAIGEENVLRSVLGEPQRTAHEGGCAGGGADPGGCFIATAAYGSDIAEEVHELREFRDQVLRATSLGASFFDEFYKYYYAFSPFIAKMMEEDSQMSAIVKSTLVHPLIIALRLFVALPKDADSPEEAVRFARRAEEEFVAWIKMLPLELSLVRDKWEPKNSDVFQALELTNNRNITVAILKRFAACFKPERVAAFKDALAKNGFSEEEVRQIFTENSKEDRDGGI